MDGIATAMIMGRVGSTPELSTIPAKEGKPETAVIRFNVAVNRWAPGAKGTRDGAERTSWFKCSMWGRDAAYLGRTMNRGDWVAVSGQLELREYSMDGVRRTAAEVRADKVVSVRAFGGQARGKRVEGASGTKGAGTSLEAPDPEDIFPPAPKGGGDDIPF